MWWYLNAAVKTNNEIIPWEFNSYGELWHQEKFGEMLVENVQQLELGYDFVVATVKDKKKLTF